MPVIQRLAAASARGFGLGVGGVGYSATIAESATGSDSVNWLTPYQGIIAESAVASEVVSISLDYWIALIEDVTASSIPIRTYDITLDASGNIYLTGLGDTSANVNGVLVLKYNNDGALQWQRVLATSTTDVGRGVTVDASGNIYIAAAYEDTTSNCKGVLVKYDSSGTLLFQSTYIATGSQTKPWALALDSAGANVYSVGSLLLNEDFFIAKHNSSGTAQWMQGYTSGTDDDLGYDAVVDSSGNIIAVGSAGNSSIPGYSYAFITKYDSSGTQLYKKRFTVTTAQRNTYYHSVAIDSFLGDIYCCGTAPYNAASGSYNIILSKFDSGANLLWTKGLYNTTSNSTPKGWGVAVDGDGMVYIVGTAPNFSPDRTIIAKYNSSGTLQWQKFIAISGRDLVSGAQRPNKISVNADAVYVTTSSEGYAADLSLVLKLPKDGSLTGTYSVGGYSVTYSDANYTEATLTYTVDTPGGTASTKTLTTTTGTATSITTTATSTTTYL